MGITQQIGASSIIKPGVCTSSTRPASPYEGQAIYETDTDKVLVYNGTAWYPNWNTAWGLAAFAQVTASDTTITAEEIQITSPTFTAVANRYYKITYTEPDLYNGAGYMISRLRLTNTSGTQFTRFDTTIGTGVDRAVTVLWVGTLSAGSTVIVATQTSSSGTGQAVRSATSPAQLIIEDIGPA